MRRWTLDVESPTVSATLAQPRGRILYVQYTNAAAYPPLEHSSQILASRGWQVLFAGIGGRGTASLTFPPFPRIQSQTLNWCAPGFLQKLHYAEFCIWVSWLSFYWRPDWIYCSDPLSAVPGHLATLWAKARVLYHEHDSPGPLGARDNWFARYIARQRGFLIETADAVVLPNQKRLDAVTWIHPPKGHTFCVWNCPSVTDFQGSLSSKRLDGTLRVLYHGTIVPERFPMRMLQALADCKSDVTIRLIGYEVPGCLGYAASLQAEAARLGVSDRFEYLGTIPLRSDLMARAAECQVGLSLLNHRSEDINMRHMVGASNKPFDYLSQGLVLIVPEEPEWRALYVDHGCALACEPNDAAALAALFSWMSDHRAEVREMGRRGRSLIESTWNYETQFTPVVQLLESSIKDRQKASISSPKT